MELTNTVEVPPPARPLPRSETPRDIPDRLVRGGMSGLTGKGVIVAVIDSGIDFHHPDFITYDAQGRPTSRLLYFWDVGSELSVNEIGEPAPIKFPSGTPIGTVYSREVLTAELRSSKPQISVWDPNGHGTSCAGVAAGNGNSNKAYTGVAPEADLIVIRGDHDGDSQLDSMYLVNAFCDWLHEKAGDRPLVVSCSWGGQYGGRDGQSICERHLSSLFPLDRRSRAICFAAGNDGDALLHATVKVGTQENPGEVAWLARGPAELSLYVQTDSLEDLTIGGVDSTVINPDNVHAFVNPLTKQAVLQIAVEGSGTLYLYSASGKDVGADAYIAGRAAQFSEDSYDLGKQIGCPSTADNVLAVGSYDWNDRFSYRGSIKLLTDVVHDKPIVVGAISAYSNPGPRRYGSQVKPELVAPGQWHTAPAPLNVATLAIRRGSITCSTAPAPPRLIRPACWPCC